MMRLTPAVVLVAVALPACARAPIAPPPRDLNIDIALALRGNKCVVSFVDQALKDPRKAIAHTDHAIVWRVVRNDCGEKQKVSSKALGLKHLRRQGAAEPAPWLGRCGALNLVPARIETPPEFRCDVPSSSTGTWEGVYDYEIDGDAIEPLDPGVDIRRNG
jgi:hypothetical protein